MKDRKKWMAEIQTPRGNSNLFGRDLPLPLSKRDFFFPSRLSGIDFIQESYAVRKELSPVKHPPSPGSHRFLMTKSIIRQLVLFFLF